VLHDWTDEDCVRILKRCKEAIGHKKDGSKVIIMDIIRDVKENDPISTETAFLFDVYMMCGPGAKERSKQEWHDIILGAGFSSYKINPASLGVYSVMELYP
jgi:trans-resveratrol di-O-methyltransferase